MGVVLVGAALALILVFHGPPTRELVVVLPGADGHVGTVVVESGTQRVVINQAYQAARVTADGALHAEQLDEREVRRTEFAGAVVALPQRPVSFQLYFVTGTDVLTDESKLEFSRMLEELRRRAAPDLVVIGHTDRQGDEEANDLLSLQRAERVKADLVAQGITEAERIRAAGRGEREPVVPTEDGADEPRNRRVEINVR